MTRSCIITCMAKSIWLIANVVKGALSLALVVDLIVILKGLPFSGKKVLLIKR